jgi:OCT family organic cation transporter-like MFS transporter 4/5
MINQLVSGIDGYGIGFLLIMELTSSSHTSFAAGVSLVAYTLGEILFTGFAYASRDWLNLKWLTSVYFAVTIPYLYFIPESPYWLFAQKKYKELENNLRTMAKINRRKESEWLPHYNELIQDSRLVTREENKVKTKKRQKILRFLPRLVISGCIEFVTMLLYTKISYGLGEENETLSPYTNFIIGAVVEGVGYLIAGFLITTVLGRKYSLIGFSLLTSACVITVPFIMKPHPTISTVILQIGKLTISGAVSVSWLYVPELFPTYMRGLANAIFVFIGSFGSILAPIVETALGEKYDRFSYYVYSGLSLALAGLITTLPETRNRSFNDEEGHEGETQADPIAAYKH